MRKICKNHFHDIPLRWVNVKNLHITLIFLGQTSISQISALSSALSGETPFIPGFHIESDMLEIRENPKKRGIIWMRMKSNSEIEYLRSRILKFCDWMPGKIQESNFIPHITLSRYNILKTGSLLQYKKPDCRLKFEVKNIQLLESELGRKSAEYKEIHSFSLG